MMRFQSPQGFMYKLKENVRRESTSTPFVWIEALRSRQNFSVMPGRFPGLNEY